MTVKTNDCQSYVRSDCPGLLPPLRCRLAAATRHVDDRPPPAAPAPTAPERAAALGAPGTAAAVAMTNTPAATAPPRPGAPAAPPPPPYSLPWQLRPVTVGNVVRSDTAMAFYEDAMGNSGSTVASTLLASYKITPEIAPMVRMGFVQQRRARAPCPRLLVRQSHRGRDVRAASSDSFRLARLSRHAPSRSAWAAATRPTRARRPPTPRASARARPWTTPCSRSTT